MEKRRDIRLDFIRICALFFVISIHFLLNTTFYQEIVTGKSMLILIILRSLFITCVPLFITLTGFLKNQILPTKKYYKKILKILIIYVLCTVLCEIFFSYYNHQPISLISITKSVLSYQYYGWYVEMFIGLFLLTPFLNLIFIHLKSKNNRILLLIVLFFIIGLPSVINIFNFKILPEWWISVYPIFYYFLGAYLSKHPIKIPTIYSLGCAAIFITLDGCFNYFFSKDNFYSTGSWNSGMSAIVMITTFFVFNSFLNLKTKLKNKKALKTIIILSNSCFAAYLISKIFDTIFYDFFNTHLEISCKQIWPFFIIVPIIFVCSLCSGIIITFLQQTISILSEFNKKIIKKIRLISDFDKTSK